MPSLTRVVFVLLIVTAGIVRGQQPGAASRLAGATPDVIKPPDTLEGLKALRDRIAVEQERLRPATQPATTAPVTQPAGLADAQAAAAALHQSLQRLADLTREHLETRAELDDGKRPERIDAFAKELQAIQRRASDVERLLASPPLYAAAEDFQRAQDEFDAQLSELSASVTLQAARAKALAEIPQRRKEARAAVQSAQTTLYEETARLEALRLAAKTDAERERIAMLLRRAVVEASLPIFEESLLGLVEERDSILQIRSEQRIPRIRALLGRLGDWKNKLREVRSRGEREIIELQLARAAVPDTMPAYEVVYWELRRIELLAREDLEAREPVVRRRFTRSMAEELKQTVAGERAHWNLFMESVERRPSGHIRDRFRQVNESIASYERRLAGMTRELDATVDEQQEVATRIEGYDGQIRNKEAELNRRLDAREPEQGDDAQVEKLRQDLMQSKRRYAEQCRSLQGDLADLIVRLRDGVQLLNGLLDVLRQHRSHLYWRHLYVSDNPVWAYRWSASRAEWTSEPERAKRAKTRERMLQLARLEAGSDTNTMAVRWIVLATALAATAAAGVSARRRARRYAHGLVDRLAESKAVEEGRTVSVSDRLHLFAARCLARTAPVLAPCATSILFLFVYEIPGREASLVLAVAALVAGLVLGQAVSRELFVAGKPRLRLLRCSNAVASHYRRWTMTLWTAAAITLPAPLLLWTLDWAYYTRGYLWSICWIVVLVITLVFSLPRHLVMRVVGRPEQVRHRRLLALVAAVYPMLWAFTAALLAAQIAGYGALVTYVVSGLVGTVATVLAAMLVARYCTEQLLRTAGNAVSTAAPPEAVGGTGVSGRTPASVDEDVVDDGGSELLRRFVAVVLRWGIAAGAIVLILRYWGVTTVEIRSVLAYELVGADSVSGRSAIAVQHVLMAVLALLAAWWASGAIRSVLDARVYPIYTTIDMGARAAINTILHYLVMLLGLYFSLFALRVPLGALTVVLGTVGLGVGLGLQPLFVNFVSGLMILFERHVRVGDIVEVGGRVGEVTSIRMRSISIKTFDNIDLVIPNSDFITQGVVNWTFQESRIRGRFPVGVAYGTDEQLVKRLLVDIARRHPLVLSYPAPDVWFTGFGESSMEFTLAAWFRTPADHGRFNAEVRFEISRVFREHGIQIPFPHRTLTTPGGRPLPVQLISHEESPQRPEPQS